MDIVSFSGGKDSTAMLLRMLETDRCIHIEKAKRVGAKEELELFTKFIKQGKSLKFKDEIILDAIENRIKLRLKELTCIKVKA